MVPLELILLSQAAELAVGYKKLGMDVCQEVVNKLGTLFFLWLSLPSLVCLQESARLRREEFLGSKPGSFLGHRQGGAVTNPTLQSPGELQEAAWALHSGHRQ